MSKVIVALIVDNTGRCVPLEDAEHTLLCEYPTVCTFPQCTCGPVERKLSGSLRPSYETQVNEAITKGRRA